MSQVWIRSAYNTATRSPNGELNAKKPPPKFTYQLTEALGTEMVNPTIVDRNVDNPPGIYAGGNKDTNSKPAMDLLAGLDWSLASNDSGVPVAFPDEVPPNPFGLSQVFEDYYERDVPTPINGYNFGQGQAFANGQPQQNLVTILYPPALFPPNQGNAPGSPIVPQVLANWYSMWAWVGGFDFQFFLPNNPNFIWDGYRNQIIAFRSRFRWNVDITIWWASAELWCAIFPGLENGIPWDNKNSSLVATPMLQPDNSVLNFYFYKIQNAKQLGGPMTLPSRTWWEVPTPGFGSSNIASGLLGQIIFAVVNVTPSAWSSYTGIQIQH